VNASDLLRQSPSLVPSAAVRLVTRSVTEPVTATTTTMTFIIIMLGPHAVGESAAWLSCRGCVESGLLVAAGLAEHADCHGREDLRVAQIVAEVFRGR